METINPKQLVVGVDDDFRVREAIASLLGSHGYRSRVFASAEDLLDSGVLSEAACLVTDVRMPGVDGIELQRRTAIERPELPVIFISAHEDDVIRRQALERGAFDFFYKPFDAVAFLDAVGRALRTH